MALDISRALVSGKLEYLGGEAIVGSLTVAGSPRPLCAYFFGQPLGEWPGGEFEFRVRHAAVAVPCRPLFLIQTGAAGTVDMVRDRDSSELHIEWYGSQGLLEARIPRNELIFVGGAMPKAITAEQDRERSTALRRVVGDWSHTPGPPFQGHDFMAFLEGRLPGEVTLRELLGSAVVPELGPDPTAEELLRALGVLVARVGHAGIDFCWCEHPETLDLFHWLAGDALSTTPAHPSLGATLDDRVGKHYSETCPVCVAETEREMDRLFGVQR